MFNLGLGMTRVDFERVSKQKKLFLLTMLLQLIAIPTLAVIIIACTKLSQPLQTGLLLIAIVPTGVTAAVFSHYMGGNAPLNVSMTTISTLVATATLPFGINWSVGTALGLAQSNPQVLQRTLAALGIIIIPVVMGLIVSHLGKKYIGNLQRVLSKVAVGSLLLLVLGSIWAERSKILAYADQLLLPLFVLLTLSFFIGFIALKLFETSRANRISVGLQLAVHNTGLAIFIGISVLGSTEYAVPAALYTVLTYCTVAAVSITRKLRLHYYA